MISSNEGGSQIKEGKKGRDISRPAARELACRLRKGQEGKRKKKKLRMRPIN